MHVTKDQIDAAVETLSNVCCDEDVDLKKITNATFILTAVAYSALDHAANPLTAAAPDLLAACEKFVATRNATNQREKLDVAYRIAEQAIEKALGDNSEGEGDL